MLLKDILNGSKLTNLMKNKLYNRGLVIGKFYPLHKGHCFLIEYALKRVNALTVIICQTEKYKIPVEVRAGWIKELYPEVDLRILKHDPSLDTESTNKSKVWAELTINFLGFTPDVVFSSEKYGKPYSFYMGSKHIMVDQKRILYEISGTKIRHNPFDHWEYLPNPVKAYFTKRVVVLGAESTGTTTLTKSLAKHYRTAWVPEYGRTYYEGKMYSNNNWNTREFFHIAQKQNEIEDFLAEQSNKILFCDTDPLATTIWHKRYMGYKDNSLEKLININKYSLYILTDTDIPFKQDGTRDGEHLREWMNGLFLKELRKRGIKFIVVKGNRKKRLHKAIRTIDNYILGKKFHQQNVTRGINISKLRYLANN